MGDALSHRAAPVGAFALGATLAWTFPEHVWFTGDGLLRLDVVLTHRGFLGLFPQAMPGDQWLHDTLPRALAFSGGPAMEVSARATGAIEAGVLALLSDAGGVSGVRMVREGRGTFGLGIALAVALHRSALIAFPAAAASWVAFARLHDSGRTWRRRLALAGLALPLITLAALGPRLVGIFPGFDLEHHLGSGAGPPPAQLLLDALNALLVLSPLALALPLLVAVDRGAWRSREGVALIPLALVWLLALFAIHPQQGLYRDWDVFAGAGVALSLWTAWRGGESLRATPRFGWLAVAVSLGVGAPALGGLMHDPERGLARARAFATEAPLRRETERVAIWDFIGIRSVRLGSWEDAADAFAHAAGIAPSPRLLTQWGLAEQQLAHLERARSLYRRAAARDNGALEAACRDRHAACGAPDERRDRRATS